MKSNIRQQVCDLRERGMTYAEVGARLGLTKDKAQKLGLRSGAPGARLTYKYPVKLPKEMVIKASSLVIVSDVHADTANKDLVRLVADTGKEYGIKTLAIVGDMANMEAFARFSHLTSPSPLGNELAACREILSMWGSVYDRIYICRGNHDDRLSYLALGQIDMEQIVDLMVGGETRQKIDVTMYDRMWVKTPDTWLLAHQKAYSRTRLSVAQKLAGKYECHVVACHQHGMAVGVSENGRYVIADQGCLADSAPYKDLNTTTYPEWHRGFSIILNGRYCPISLEHPIGGISNVKRTK